MGKTSIQSRLTNAHRNFYEGGKKTQANRDFWNATSPFEETATVDRDTLRARARWLYANNPIMANIDGAIIDNVVGQGITLQSRIGKKKLDDDIELRYKTWCEDKNKCDSSGRMNFYDIQRVILGTRMVDGEIFIYKRYTDEGLKLQMIEADALDGGQDNGIERSIHRTVFLLHCMLLVSQQVLRTHYTALLHLLQNLWSLHL